MAVKLTAKDKSRIQSGRDLSKQIKALEKELTAIKDDFKERFEEGTYVGNDSAVMIIGEKISFEEPAPKAVLRVLKEQGKADEFPDCVKILVEKTRDAIGTEQYDKIKGKRKTTTSISFK